jgi:hypothetical protein
MRDQQDGFFGAVLIGPFEGSRWRGDPRSEASFIRIYRKNLAAYIEAPRKSFRGPGTAYRTKILTDDQLWKEVAEIGNREHGKQVRSFTTSCRHSAEHTT